MVLLLSVLSNFEPPQLTSASGASTAATKRVETRADLQKQVDELHAELVDRYSAGETVKSLAAEHGLHHQTVRAVLVQAGALVRTRQRLAQCDIEEIVRLYEAGLTTTEIGEQFGVYASTIGRKLRKLGIELRVIGGVTMSEIRRARLWQAYERGFSDNAPRGKRPDWLPMRSDAAETAEQTRLEFDPDEPSHER